ncbi:MAG: hypothetical protein QM733_20785 [Ilumatobacteraceae bacterium]
MVEPVEPPVEQPQDESPRKRGWVRWALLAVSLVIAGMWGYIFLVRPTPIYTKVYVMTTPGWQDAAKAICTEANARRVALGDMSGGLITDPTPEQMRERADIVEKATDILEQMVADVAAIPVDNAGDAGRMETFQKYYGMVIGDRRRYVDELRDLEKVPYTESEAAGGPVSNVITDFTSANGIERCAPPGELANN